MLHNPSLQKKLQKEVDSVVGRERKPCLDDRDNMPIVLSFITEIHRHATIAPLAVQVDLHILDKTRDQYIYKRPESFSSLYSKFKQPQ